jgi:hypothetical protein
VAGDWIKMSHGLRTHPKVVTLSSQLKCDRLRVIGALFVIWCVTDEHSTDGFLDGFTLEAMDDELRFPGFCAALLDVGWLDKGANGGLIIPDFSEHNGESAKVRAEARKRKRQQREREELASQKSHKKVTKKSRSQRDKSVTREEKKVITGAKAPVPKVTTGSSLTLTNPPTDESTSPPTNPVWAAYSEAYEVRYRAPPVRNARVNSLLTQFIARVPKDEAPAIAAWYLRSDRGLYAAARHPVDLLLRDAEALRTDWATGTQRSDNEARRGDRKQATGQAVRDLIEEQRGGGDGD